MDTPEFQSIRSSPNTNLTQQKHNSAIKRNAQQHKINIKKPNPGLVASYDIRPGNGEDYSGFGAP